MCPRRRFVHRRRRRLRRLARRAQLIEAPGTSVIGVGILRAIFIPKHDDGRALLERHLAHRSVGIQDRPQLIFGRHGGARRPRDLARGLSQILSLRGRRLWFRRCYGRVLLGLGELPGTLVLSEGVVRFL